MSVTASRAAAAAATITNRPAGPRRHTAIAPGSANSHQMPIANTNDHALREYRPIIHGVVTPGMLHSRT